jgi:hypothetical protein
MNETEACNLKIGTVQIWLKMQPKNFLLMELKKLVKCWNRCIEVKGVYIDK